MPFDALKGFREALREKERIVVPKIELTPEYQEELDYIMHQVQIGCMVKIIYFQDDTYLQISGMVSRFDKEERVLQVVNTQIAFEDIYQVEVL